MVVLYGHVIGWPQTDLPQTLEEAEELYERLFPQVLASGTDVFVHAVERALRDRVASITADEWSALVPELGLPEPASLEPLHALFPSIADLGKQARQRDEDLWLFGRV